MRAVIQRGRGGLSFWFGRLVFKTVVTAVETSNEVCGRHDHSGAGVCRKHL
jgi:hypothetical protein